MSINNNNSVRDGQTYWWLIAATRYNGNVNGPLIRQSPFVYIGITAKIISIVTWCVLRNLKQCGERATANYAEMVTERTSSVQTGSNRRHPMSVALANYSICDARRLSALFANADSMLAGGSDVFFQSMVYNDRKCHAVARYFEIPANDAFCRVIRSSANHLKGTSRCRQLKHTCQTASVTIFTTWTWIMHLPIVSGLHANWLLTMQLVQPWLFVRFYYSWCLWCVSFFYICCFREEDYRLLTIRCRNCWIRI